MYKNLAVCHCTALQAAGVERLAEDDQSDCRV